MRLEQGSNHESALLLKQKKASFSEKGDVSPGFLVQAMFYGCLSQQSNTMRMTKVRKGLGGPAKDHSSIAGAGDSHHKVVIITNSAAITSTALILIGPVRKILGGKSPT